MCHANRYAQVAVMGGRRAHYTTRIAKRLCEHIALGDTLKTALEREPLAPTVPMFWRWLEEYPEFREMYERARLLQTELISDTILSMAKEVLEKPKFAPAYRVAADILRWQAEVKNPLRYGQKTQVEHHHILDPLKIAKEIKQLEKELGLLGEVDAPLTLEATLVENDAQE